MTEESIGEWVELVVEPDYEIWSEYPHPIRRKGSDRIINGWLDKSTGYVHCKLNCRKYKKHRLIAQQFIPNDDPTHKTQVDHINHNKTDNRIENLRWCSASDNQKNKPTNGHGQAYVFIDELPDSTESLDAYNGHEFDGLFIDYESQKLYLFNGVKYRELVACRNKGNICYYINDIENINRALYHKVLFG